MTKAECERQFQRIGQILIFFFLVTLMLVEETTAGPLDHPMTFYVRTDVQPPTTIIAIGRIDSETPQRFARMMRTSGVPPGGWVKQRLQAESEG